MSHHHHHHHEEERRFENELIRRELEREEMARYGGGIQIVPGTIINPGMPIYGSPVTYETGYIHEGHHHHHSEHEHHHGEFIQYPVVPNATYIPGVSYAQNVYPNIMPGQYQPGAPGYYYPR